VGELGVDSRGRGLREIKENKRKRLRPHLLDERDRKEPPVIGRHRGRETLWWWNGEEEEGLGASVLVARSGGW
jgi:hypothetical protein